MMIAIGRRDMYVRRQRLEWSSSEQPVLGLFIEVGKGPFFMDVRYIDLEHIEETYIASLL